ncbi:MAG: O-antigen polysaccharide polymerase Wzy family protein [Eggerthellaceae bacterium]|nr:O-antigen polysaccharide polymerase Wzy family protein [Eggerthellaceae bacterium]
MTSTVPINVSKGLAKLQARDIVLVVQSACFALGILVYASGLWLDDFQVQFAGVFLMFLSNVVYAALRLETRSMLLFLYLGMFLFWLTRPLFGIVYYDNGAWLNRIPSSVTFAFLAIAVALFFTRLGCDCYEWVSDRWAPKRESRIARRASKGKSHRLYGNDLAIKAIRQASLIVFAICFVGAVAYRCQEFLYARSVSYEALHLVSASTYSSSTLGTLSTMAPYAMCVYLATMPSKKPATTLLLLNIVTTVPTLLTGSRGSFVLAVLFLVFYYLFRAFARHEKGWVTKFEVTLVVVAVPLGIFGLGMVNYLRGGHDIAPESILETFVDAFYKQGVTFSVLQYAFNTNPDLQLLGFKFYTLGPLTHTITQGFIGQQFLGCELLPESNSIELAVKGTSYAHSMSYVTHWNYLGGEGYGSSFVLEAFADFGYAGMVVVSALVGIVMAFFSNRLTRGGLCGVTIALLAARAVFFLPRAETLEWLSFLWATRFWLAVVIIALLALFLYWRLQKAHTIQSSTETITVSA